MSLKKKTSKNFTALPRSDEFAYYFNLWLWRWKGWWYGTNSQKESVCIHKDNMKKLKLMDGKIKDSWP